MLWQNKSAILVMDTWKKKTNKQTNKQTNIITIKEALRKEKGNQKQPFASSTSSSWNDVLGFKEIYSIIFEI